MNEFVQISAARSAPVRHFEYLGMRVPNAWATFGLVFAFALAGLLAESFGKQAAVAAYLGLVGGTVVLFPHFTLSANRRNALLWAFPVWAVFSAGWSIDPDRTWHSSLLLVASLVGVCAVGAMPQRRAVSTAIFLVLFGFVLVSLAFGHLIQMGADGTAFSGLLAGKNQFGHTAAMEVIASCAMLSWAGDRYGRPLVLLGLVGVLAGFVALLASHATGALLATGLAVATVASIIAFRRLAPPFRVALVIALIGIATVYLSFGKEIEQQLFAYVLQRFGKDTTLTGRTMLWDIADRLIAEQPMLGRGYGAFWYYTNPDAMMVWRMVGVQPMTGFTFHNTFRDILIECGMIGLALFALGIGYHFIRNSLAAFRSGDVLSAVRVATVLYFVIRMPVEEITYGPLTLSGLTLIGFLSFTETGKASNVHRAAANSPRSRAVAEPIVRASYAGLRTD